MAELIVIVQPRCLCVGRWVGGCLCTFVRMCVSNFLFTLGPLMPRMKSLRLSLKTMGFLVCILP